MLSLCDRIKNWYTASKKKTIWMFCFNHGMNDQKSINLLVTELMNFVHSYPHSSKVMENQCFNGQKAQENKVLSFPPSMEVALSTDISVAKLFRWALPQIFSSPLKEASYVPSRLAQNYKEDPAKYAHFKDPSKRLCMIECLRLSKEETSALVRVCRSNDVTVTSALCAAMLSIASLFLQNGIVDGDKREELRTQNMKVLLPVCSRKYGLPYGTRHQDSVDSARTEESMTTTFESAGKHTSDHICSDASSVAPDSSCNTSQYNSSFSTSVSSIVRGESCTVKGNNIFSSNVSSMDREDSCSTSKNNSMFSSSVSSIVRGDSCSSTKGKKSFSSSVSSMSRGNSSGQVTSACSTSDWTRGVIVCAAGCVDFVVPVPVSTVIHARNICEAIEHDTVLKSENPEFWSLAKDCRMHSKDKVEKTLAENLLFFEFLMKQIKLVDILNGESENPSTMGRFSHCGVSNVGVADLANAVRSGRLGGKGEEGTPGLVLKDAYFASGNAYFGFFVTLYAMTVDDQMSLTLAFTSPLMSSQDAILFKTCLLSVLRELVSSGTS